MTSLSLLVGTTVIICLAYHEVESICWNSLLDPRFEAFYNSATTNLANK